VFEYGAGRGRSLGGDCGFRFWVCGGRVGRIGAPGRGEGHLPRNTLNKPTNAGATIATPAPLAGLSYLPGHLNRLGNITLSVDLRGVSVGMAQDRLRRF
jgi:hypothetical protein